MANKDLVEAIRELNQNLTDEQYSMVLKVLTEYSVDVTDSGYSYVAKVVSQVTELLHACRTKYKHR